MRKKFLYIISTIFILCPLFSLPLNKDSLRQWNSYSNKEKFFLELSSNLIGSKSMSFTILVPEGDDEDTVYFVNNSKDTLRDSWEVENRETLLYKIKLLDNEDGPSENDMSTNFEFCKKIIEENPRLSVEEIAVKYAVTPYQKQALYFVYCFYDETKEKGIKAYDWGRQLVLLRWGIAAGYISLDEALEYAEPIEKKITDKYDSFVEYMESYVFGRLLLGMQEGMADSRFLYAIDSADSFYNCFKKNLPTEFFRDNAIMPDDYFSKYIGSFKKISENYSSYNLVYSTFYKDASSDNVKKSVVEMFPELAKKFPKDLCVNFYYARELINQDKLETAYYIMQGIEDVFTRMDKEHWFYYSCVVTAFQLSYYTNHGEKVLHYYNLLDGIKFFDDLTFETKAMYYEMMGYANASLINKENSLETNLKYRDDALMFFNKVKFAIDVPDRFTDYLISYGTEYPTADNAVDAFELGREYYAAGRYLYAVSLFEQAIKYGSSNAEVELANCYLKGDGVPQNYKAAFELFMSAAEKDNLLGMFNVAVCYQNGEYVKQNQNEATKWFMKSAEGGFATAQRIIAERYFYGNHLEKNDELAFSWALKAAEQGEADALNLVAVFCNEGIGTEKDVKKGYDYFIRAIRKENVFAFYNLGMSYRNKVYADEGNKNASYYLSRAAERGYVLAMIELAKIYEESTTIPNHLQSAILWYEKANEAGFENAQEEIDRLTQLANKY